MTYDDRLTLVSEISSMDDEIMYHILSIALPREAADALDFGAIQKTAIDAGFDRTAARMEVSSFRAHGKTRITLRLIMALRVFVALRDAKRLAESLGAADDVRLARALELAIRAVLDAITAEMERPQSMSPAAGIGKEATERRGATGGTRPAM